MNIIVVGYKGVVGNATYQLLSRLGNVVVGVDKGDIPVSGDITFACLPETLLTTEVLREYKTKLYIVRSTVPPGTCQRLQDRLGVHVLHNPEFLRENSAVMDAFTPDRIIIGECCPEHGDLLEGLYKPLARPVYRTGQLVSELTKLACNGWLATIISYWNEIDSMATKLGISGTEVGMLASTDPRIGNYGSRLHNQFDGKCLPKDMRQLINTAGELGIKARLLKAVMGVNMGANEGHR